LSVRDGVLGGVVAQLDNALDLRSLAREAALSPFHFNRVFRGMLGETPLELHRRLRMERAAHLLLATDASVTTVAFGAGYETHESFTRAFHKAYGVAPSAFQRCSRERAESTRRLRSSSPRAAASILARRVPSKSISHSFEEKRA
jgi:AraC family transcriptional regulator